MNIGAANAERTYACPARRIRLWPALKLGIHREGTIFKFKLRISLPKVQCRRDLAML